MKHQPSEAISRDLFHILTFVDDGLINGVMTGNCFEPQEVPKNLKRFFAGHRLFMPMLEVICRDVRQNPGARGKTAKVYDVPLNLIVDRLLQSRGAMKSMRQNLSGEVLPGGHGVRSEHYVGVPTRPASNLRRSLAHGEFACNTPLYGLDGIKSVDREQVYVGDIAMCRVPACNDAPPAQWPCRLIGLYFDEDVAAADLSRSTAVMVRLRRFRTLSEVIGSAAPAESTPHQLQRIWEESEAGADITVVVRPEEVLGLCRVLPEDAIAGVGNDLGDWKWSNLRAGWTFAGAGFVTRRAQPTHRGGGFRIIDKRWKTQGSGDGRFVDVRADGVFHNEQGVPFIQFPFHLFNDRFACYGIGGSSQVPHRFGSWINFFSYVD